MHVTSASRVNRSFMIDVYSAERNCFVLPLFEWNFAPMLWFRFIVLAGKAIGCQSTYPIKHSRPIVKSLGIGIGLRCSHVSTHLIVVSQSETSLSSQGREIKGGKYGDCPLLTCLLVRYSKGVVLRLR